MPAAKKNGKSTKKDAEIKIRPGFYRHSKKGTLYKVFGIGHHSETLEPLVIYQALYNSPDFGRHALWIRPASMFIEKVTIDGVVMPRFVWMGRTKPIIKKNRAAPKK